MAVESDDPLLIAHARELTEGATDSWTAATRISRWVANNIQYAIPGGGTARRATGSSELCCSVTGTKPSAQ